MQENMNVSSMPKTSSFQMRINPEVKKRLEEIYANCGMTLTDAVNVFIQQSINVEGLPFLVTQSSKEALREQAIALLMTELKKGEDSVRSDTDWISEEEMLAEFGETP
jgi:addiction module RelB/DinJ family antitoxin